MSASTLKSIFSRPGDQYELLVNKADASVAAKITELNVPGVYTEFEPERYYPLSTVASQVLGYVGPNARTIPAKADTMDWKVIITGSSMALLRPVGWVRT